MARHIAACLLLLLAPVALAQSWSLSVRETNLEDGTALSLLAEPGRLVITRSAGDAPATLIGVIELTEDQSNQIALAIADTWDANADERGLVSDRPQAVRTDLRLALDGQTRRLRVGDVHVPELVQLTAALNQLVGVESRLIYPLMVGRSPAAGRPIVAGLEVQYFRTEVGILNRQEENLVPVLRKLRRVVEDDDDARALEATAILDRVAIWHTQQLDAVRSWLLDDRPSAYENAGRVAELLRGDELGLPFSEVVRDLSRNQRELREIRATLALREATVLGHEVGLDGDLDVVNWTRFNQRKAARALDLLAAVNDRWSRTAAADEAATLRRAWARRVGVLNEMQPAWRYTHSFALIPIGTEQHVTIRTDDNGNITTTIDEEIVFDRNQVYMSGTFQNTSSRAHRYTFVVAVSSSNGRGSMFDPEIKQQLLGYERIQSPLLEPGELFNWETVLTIQNVYAIRRCGVGQVAADQPHQPE